MTCIIGLVSGSHVYIGGDSAGVAGYSLTVRSDPKVFINGEFVMGFTTSFRMGQLLRFKFKPPPVPENKDPYEYMVTDFIEAVRTCLKAGGYLKKENDREEGGTFLVGWRGVLYEICDDLQVGIAGEPFDAVGCGHDLAKGAVAALLTTRLQHRPKQLIISALEIVEAHNAGVRGPFVIRKV